MFLHDVLVLREIVNACPCRAGPAANSVVNHTRYFGAEPKVRVRPDGSRTLVGGELGSFETRIGLPDFCGTDHFA